MKLKKQQILLLVVALIVVVLVASVALMLNTENGSSPNGNGDVVETGNWIDLTDNIGLVATICSEEYGYPSFSDIFFIDEQEGWITSSCNAEIYHTTDGGETWEVQTTLRSCQTIYMLSNLEGYAGGASGFVYHTIDGGETWEYFGTAGGLITDIDFPPNSDTGYCCGFGSVTCSISSSGLTQIESGTFGDIDSLSFPKEDEGWYCHTQNVIRHFTDGAWTSDQSYVTGGYDSIFFVPNTLQGWVVGDSGFILHTTDGRVWQRQSIGDLQNVLLDVYFINENEGWVAGAGPVILHTFDGGETWTIVHEEDTGEIFSTVFPVDENTVYICGNRGTLLKYVGDN